MIAYGDKNLQDVVTGVENVDTVAAYINVETPTGTMALKKTSEDNLMEGVKFHLYGTSFSGLPVDEYAVTDAKGLAAFKNVLISGSTPYTLEAVEIELVNYFTKGSIELTKVDEDYPAGKLSGAVFEVYADSNGNGEYDKVDALLGELSEVEKGIYRMDDIRYGRYFVREKTAPTGFVLGVDKKEEYPFMVCYCSYDNPLGAAWATEAVGTDDYLEAMQIFLDRVQGQVEMARAEQDKYKFDMTPFTADDCIPDNKGKSIVGKVVVINAEPKRYEYQHSAYQPTMPL